MSDVPQDPARDPDAVAGSGSPPPFQSESTPGSIPEPEGFDIDDDSALTGDVVDGNSRGVDPDTAARGPVDSLDVEGLVLSLETVTAERNKWQDAAQRGQAEFENYKKQSQKRLDLDVERISARIVEALLPVLDACDGAVVHGADGVAPIQSALLDALSAQGLERLVPAGEAFDPEAHDAVMHEAAAADGPDYPVVAEVMRAGYRWQGRTLRPAMVRVQG